MGKNNLVDAGANLLNAATDNAEIVKDVYSDAVKPATQEIGKALVEPIKGVTRIGRFLNAICSPIDIWILNKEYSVKEYSLEKALKLMEKKLEKVPEEKLVIPPNYVLIPALQAISISIDNEVLRNMYANLLAKSVYKETSEKTHPAYVDIIRQMSPIDAIIFKKIVNNQNSLPTKEFRIVDKLHHLTIQSNYFLTNIVAYEVPVVSASLGNLIRLGLISKEQGTLFDQTLYAKIDKNVKVCEFCKNEKERLITDPENQTMLFDNNSLFLTAFGETFYDICCTNID